jgi:hypothetical protein
LGVPNHTPVRRSQLEPLKGDTKSNGEPFGARSSFPTLQRVQISVPTFPEHPAHFWPSGRASCTHDPSIQREHDEMFASA